MTGRPVIRFAPSPNGELHLGHAFSALFAFRAAQTMGARFLLRIEDIDIARCRPEFEAQMLDDLAWLGLTWEEPVRRQSEHFEAYREACDKLAALDLLYPCFASRKEIDTAALDEFGKTPPRDPDGSLFYPGLHKGMGADEVTRRQRAGEPFALRLDLARALAKADELGGVLSFDAFSPDAPDVASKPCDPARWGDAVIARKDVPTSYHLAVVVDDALQGITHVVRGEDLLAATDIHRLLQRLLGLPAPRYHHHRLICDAAGRKLSKRDKDKSLKHLRATGLGPAQITEMVGLAG